MIDQYRWFEHPGFEGETYPKVERLRVNVSGRATAVINNPEYYHSDAVLVLIDAKDDYSKELLAKGNKVTSLLDKEEEFAEKNPFAGFEGTYWGGRGQAEIVKDKINEFIPQKGRAGEPGAEMVRILRNLYYDYFNNGYANITTYEDEASKVRKHREKIKSRLLDEDNYNKWSTGLKKAKTAYNEGERIDDALPPGHREAVEDVMNASVLLAYKMIDNLPGGFYRYENPAMQTYISYFNANSYKTPDEIIEFFGGKE